LTQVSPPVNRRIGTCDDPLPRIPRIVVTMADYAFVTRWRLSAPVERVFDVIDMAREWPAWWPGVKSVQVLEEGGPDKVGMVTRTTWRSRLPYDLTFNARTVKREAPRAIEVEAFGELEGRGRWELAPDGADGEATLVTYYWSVITNKWWMNLLAPIARPMFQKNHDVIMRWGGEGLGRRLGVKFEERSGR
jgi:Polyketide cyclase / dehydrase and lipid transport